MSARLDWSFALVVMQHVIDALTGENTRLRAELKAARQALTAARVRLAEVDDEADTRVADAAAIAIEASQQARVWGEELVATQLELGAVKAELHLLQRTYPKGV